MKSLVRARTLQGFGDLVADLGADPKKILKHAGLDASVLNQSNEWISFRSVVIAYELAALATGCENFGIQLSGRRDLSVLGPLALIFKYSRDVEHGLSSCIKYMSVQNTAFKPVLEVGKNTASWQLRIDEKLRAHANQWMEDALLTTIQLIRIFLGEDYIPHAVHCRHSAYKGTDYEGVFGTGIKFQAPTDAIILNREDLKSPNSISDQDVYMFIQSYLDLHVLQAGEGLSGAVRSLLRKLIPTGMFSVNVVADQLMMHRRTLQRRLHDAGLTYTALLDESRAEVARDYLSTSNLPIGNLAYMLGFADQSAFNRAFRRWYGLTPREWRDSNESYTSEAVRRR